MITCKQCASSFDVTEADVRFYERVSPEIKGKRYAIPNPTLCPDCRQQRRNAWRNERKLYKRKCGLCDKSILAMFKEEAPFPVYCPDCWWGDNWDPYDYGVDFDFNRSFFEQFSDLRDKVPHVPLAVLSKTMENSDYCNHAGYLKNCYLIINSDYSEQCLYGKGVNRCFDCVDCFKVYDCEACYESSNCNNCSFSTYLSDSYTCNECHFSANLIGCQSCFGCVNLRNKEFYFFNEKLSEEEYKKRVTDIQSKKTNAEILEDFEKFKSTYPQKWMQENNTENCTGEYLVNCKNCTNCYDCEYLEDSKFCTDLKKGDKLSFNNRDVSYFGVGVENCYECAVSGYGANHTVFCENVWESFEVMYSHMCMQNSHHLFGCVGIRHGEYSVFNKKYGKDEYYELVRKIIDHMKKTPAAAGSSTGEWGEFFPITISPIAYNESVSQEYYPLSKEEVLNRGWKWYDEEDSKYPGVNKVIEAGEVPRDISLVPDEILNWALKCEESGKLFKIQKMELEFYRKRGLPIPLFHPDVRHAKRFAMRRQRKMFQRDCDSCGTGIETSFESGGEKKVFCEKCYLKSLP